MAAVMRGTLQFAGSTRLLLARYLSASAAATKKVAVVSECSRFDSEEVRQRHAIASGMQLTARFVYIFSIDYKNVVSSKAS